MLATSQERDGHNGDIASLLLHACFFVGEIKIWNLAEDTEAVSLSQTVALGYVEQGGGAKSYTKALQPVISQLTEINVSTEPNEYRWQRLTLNTTGERVDAVRFRIPDTEASFDLMWTIVLAPEMVDCCLLPTTGERVEATERFVYAQTAVQTQGRLGTRFGGDLGRLIESPGIQPGKEYMICFTLTTREPVDTAIFIKPMPKGSSMREGWCPLSNWQSDENRWSLQLLEGRRDGSITASGVRQA